MNTLDIDEFPLSVFPEPIQHIVNDYHTELNYPKSFIAASLLLAVSSAIGNSRRINVKSSWSENASLFMALVGEPGSIKSHPISSALGPIQELDHRSIEKYNLAIDEYNNQPPDRRGQKPIATQRIISDTTLEAVGELLYANPLGLTMYSDELDGWISSFDKYHKKGGEVNQWLSMNSGKRIVINRKSSNRIITILQPFMNVIGSIQPSILKRSFSGANRENGLLSRFLFIQDPSEFDAIIWEEEDLPSGVADTWKNYLLQIVKSSDYFSETHETRILSIDQEGVKEICLWHNCMEEAIKQKKDLIEREVFRKVQTYTYRFAIILHVMHSIYLQEETNVINKDIAEKARTLAHYFFRSNVRIYNSLIDYKEDTQNSIDEGSLRWNEFLDKLPRTFYTSIALSVADELGIPQRTCFEYLKKSTRIEKIAHGEYKKK